jgi:cytochrome c biogenesis protein CcmG/thiol:disulfide interchange protein DsbE
MNRFLLPLAGFVLLAVVLALGLKHAPEKGVVVSPLVGKPAPEFNLPRLEDPSKTVSSGDLRGRWYLFNVWGTWCVTCRAEHGTLLKAARSGVVRIIGMDWRDEDADAQQWLSKLGNPYELVVTDHDGRGAVDWGVTMAPESFLVNPQGVIVYKCSGEVTDTVWEKEILPRISQGGVRAPNSL